MIPIVNDLHLALAIAPVAGALAVRALWSRRRLDVDLHEREERARLARHEAMRAMRQALAASEAARKSREEFVARMSHELRTPLNAVIGLSRVLENNKAGNQRPQDIQLLSRVRAGGEQLLRMVEDVLDQSHIEQGQLSLSLVDTSVVDVVARAVSGYLPMATKKGLSFMVVMPATAPALQLDAGRFEQVVQHLLDNAVKFTSVGGVTVTLVTDAATRRPARLIVADSGIGIPDDRLEQIFEPFAQVNDAKNRRYGGAGLGLPLARQLCEAMGCQLTVGSEVGAGSRFVIRFPAA